jgi:hypothetical protein
VSGLLRDSAHVRQARPRCLRCCPRVAVVPLSRPPHRARGGHEPLRLELAALLGVCPLSQPGWCAGSCASWRLAGDVAVLSRWTWTGDPLLAKVVAATGGPAAAQLKSTAACSVNDRESPYATLLTARGGHGRAPVCHRLIIGSVEICWHAHDLLVWR